MGTPLGAMDRLFLRLESPTTPMHVGGVLVFRGAAHAATHLARLRAAPVVASPFDWRLRDRPGAPAWERVSGATPEVGHVRLAAPGDDAALMAEVSRLHSRPLDRARPLWECHVIEGLSGDRFAVYYKMHHACIDGVSAIRRLQAALSPDPRATTTPLWAAEPPPRAPRARAPGGGPASAARSAAELAACLGRLALAARDPDPTRTATPYTAPGTPLNPMLGPGRRVAWQRLPLHGVRAVAHRAGVTINDVALALCAHVLRDLLRARDALPDRPLVAMVPVSLRGPAGDGDDAGASAGGNAVGSILCKLGTHLHGPRERLDAVAGSARAGKAMVRAMSPAAAAGFSLAYSLPAVAAQLTGLARRAPLPFNVVVSNVPGPRAPLYCDGAELEAIYPVSLLFERQALNFTLVSCGDHLDVGLLACADSVPDLGAIAAQLVDAYRALDAAV